MSTVAAPDGCWLCRDLEKVRYEWRDERKPAPFCSACGRRLPVVMVAFEEPPFQPPRRILCACS